MIAGLKPAVPRRMLLVLAGLMWTTVGIMLCRLSYMWLEAIHWKLALCLGLIGITLAWVVFRLGFSYIAQKNIDRICVSTEKRCIFAFQAWKTYLLIAVMITFGIFLRKTPIPEYYLSIIYATIGGALLLSSFKYYFHLWRAGRVVASKETL